MSHAPYTLPPLPYAHDALEPHIDARTLELHHGKHHASYVAKLNEALADEPELARRDAEWLMRHLDDVPRPIRTAVRDNAGGHANHSMFWRLMSPAGARAPGGALADAIARDFGDTRALQEAFDTAGAAVFGSGWVWLASDAAGALSVVTTSGHDNPVMDGLHPVLVNDVWEHAYYLKHQNRRPEYLAGWWAVMDWREAAARYDGRRR